jgi:hypothetical protein
MGDSDENLHDTVPDMEVTKTIPSVLTLDNSKQLIPPDTLWYQNDSQRLITCPYVESDCKGWKFTVFMSTLATLLLYTVLLDLFHVSNKNNGINKV